MNEKLNFSYELEQHRVVHGGLKGIQYEIQDMKEDMERFDAEKLKSMLEALRDPLARIFSFDAVSIAE